jgi:mono/diheme cytochrome c family protein
MVVWVFVLALSGGWGCDAWGGAVTAEQRTFFESRIRPILVKECLECHAEGAKKLGGKLYLDDPVRLRAGGESGPALVEGKPSESLLIQAVRYEGPEMPPKHRLSDAAVSDLVRWVEMGAPDPRTSGDAQKGSGSEVGARGAGEKSKSADLWSFRPRQRVEVPRDESGWSRGAVDAFLRAKAASRGHGPSLDASGEVVLRRLHYVLTGLRPTDEEVRVFEVAYAADADLAMAREADRLLGSVRYGERWGRHWLDVARFGESNGNDGLGRNPTFSHAWRYRDYVIDAFNVDLPYDRFLTEQIAGDLLEACSSEEGDRWLVATGFLAIGAKPAKAMNDNFEMDVVADQIAAVGSGILGISLGCARCHDHKHDPVSTRDYYALAGIFKSTETLWGPAAYEALTAPQTPLHVLVAAARSPVPAPESLPQPKKKDEKKPAKAAFPQLPGTPLAMGVRDARKVGDCKINIGGESKKLGPEVPRGFLSAIGGLGVELGLGSGRLELARWLTRPEHPLTARVMVNRVWQQVFGKGIVRTPDDFGVYGAEPTHRELLDYLAEGFVAGGWSVKRLIRELVTSHAFRQSSFGSASVREIDPDNEMVMRYERRRMDAEAFRDGVLQAAGILELVRPEGSVVMHLEVQVNRMGSLHREDFHRSVYLPMLRNSMPPALTPFNFPDGTMVTGVREETTLPGQALFLQNGAFLDGVTERMASGLVASSGTDEERVMGLFRRVLGRAARVGELEESVGYLRGVAQREGSNVAWASLCRVLLMGNEFRYVD